MAVSVVWWCDRCGKDSKDGAQRVIPPTWSFVKLTDFENKVQQNFGVLCDDCGRRMLDWWADAPDLEDR